MSGAPSTLLGGDAATSLRLVPDQRPGPQRTADLYRPAGQRARIRFINAGADTGFRVALGGHEMTVTRTDGYPVEPVQADALLIGDGGTLRRRRSRLGDGVFPLVALAEGKDATALALVRTGVREPPPATIRPAELGRRARRVRGLAPGGTGGAGVPEARRDLPAGADRRDGPLRLGYRRPGLRHVPAPERCSSS